MPEFAAIFWKELYQFSYRRRFTVENVLFIGAMICLFLQTSSDLYPFAGRRPAVDYVAMSRFGRDCLLAGAGSVAFVFSVAALLFGAETLSREVSRGTLLFLVLLPGDPAIVLAAKLAAVVARVFLWLLLLVPIGAIASSFGGFDWPVMAVTVLFAFVNVVLYAAIGLVGGATIKSRTDAFGRAVGVAILLNWAFAGLASLSLHVGFPLGSLTFGSCTVAGPVQFAAGGIIRLDFVVLPAGILLFLSALFFLAARGLWVKNMLVLVTPASTRDKLTTAPRRRRWFILPRLSRFARRFIEPGMVLRELSVWGLEWMILLPMVCAPFLIVILMVRSPNEIYQVMWNPVGQIFLFMFAFNTVAVILAFQASRRIVAERESGTLQFLGITALEPSGILISKAVAVFISQIPSLAILFLHALWLVRIGVVPGLLFIPFIISVALALAIAPAIGLYFSLAAKKASSAALCAVYIGAAFFVALTFPFDKSSYRDGDWEPLLIWLFFAVVALLAACGFTFLARRYRLGLIAHTLAFAALSAHVFLVKYAFSPQGSFYEGPVYLFKASPLGFPYVLALIPLLLAVLAWLAWTMTSTFDTHVRAAA